MTAMTGGSLKDGTAIAVVEMTTSMACEAADLTRLCEKLDRVARALGRDRGEDCFEEIKALDLLTEAYRDYPLLRKELGPRLAKITKLLALNIRQQLSEMGLEFDGSQDEGVMRREPAR